MTTKQAASGLAVSFSLLCSIGMNGAGASEALSGEALFYMNCATCHVGSSALMGLAPPPDLFRDPLPAGDSAAALSAVIRVGAGGGRMPPFADGLNETETRALVAFIRSQRQR